MRLEKLEIRGFKSFAQKVEIAFDKGMTAIVGPNGSGKSNIADAIRWVLGEQSAKQLRGGKMEDVIFSGSDGARAQAYCEVALGFDNADRALPLDFHEVSVMRRVYRSGESEYFINRNACRLRDIVDLFRDTGVGKEGYSIIGQGRVDEILSSHGEERRTVFEEAAGITKYKARKLESERKLEKTLENRLRIEDILQELGGQLEPLQAQSEKARQYLKLREELKTIELNVFLMQYDVLSKRMKDHEAIARQASEECAAIDAKIDGETADAQALTAELRAREAETSERHANLLQLTSDAEKADGEIALLAERISGQNDEIARATDRNATLAEKLAGWDAWLSGASDDSGLKKALVEAVEAEIAGAESALLAETEALHADEEALDAAKNAIIEAMNRLSNAKVQSSRLETMRATLIERRAAAEDEAKKCEAEIADLDADTTRDREGFDALTEESKAIAVRSDALQHEAERAKAEARCALETLRADERKRDEANSRLKVLREMTRDYEGYNASVRRLLRDAQRDVALGEGIQGVVATLIHVPAQFEKAIENALGPALQQIVTTDEQAAQRAIAHLRSRSYGRATFLPQSAIRAKSLSDRERRVLDRPGCFGVASDLIRCDEDHRAIAAHLLGRTVVVESLDIAVPLARETGHAFRIATLQGDLINPGGSMTGGSAQKSEFSLLGRGREIDELAASLQALESAIRDASAAQEAHQTAIAAFDEGIALCDKERHAIELALTRQSEKLDILARLGVQQRDRAATIAQEIEQIAETLADVEAQLHAADAQQGAILEAHDSSQQDIKDAQQALSEKRLAREASVEALNEQKIRLMALQKETSAHDAEVARIRNERTAALMQQARDESSRKDGEARIAQWTSEQNACRERAVSLREAIATAESESAASNAEHLRLREQVDAIGRAIEYLRLERHDLDERRHKAELAAEKACSEWESLQERIWDEYELSYEGALSHRIDIAKETAQRGLEACRTALKSLGDVNVNAIDDYQAVKERHDTMSAQRDDLQHAQDDLEALIADLTDTMCRQFSEQFARIGSFFAETFRELFNGGRAELRLSDPNDVMNSGIEIIAQPPGKKLQLLSLLSGGERALTAIALLFSMLKLKPTPFCILDEIEASLDEANVDLFANYVKRYAADTQFILITHRKGSMAACDALYGVVMEGKGVSRLVSVKLSDAEKLMVHSA